MCRSTKQTDYEKKENVYVDFGSGGFDSTRALPAYIFAGTLANAGLALAYFGADISTVIALLDRALALNPNFARGWYIAAIARLFAGEFDRAIEFAEASLRFSPRGRFGQVLT